MSILRYLPAITSTAFRGAVFLFLRIIPSRWGKTVIPALFICYIASLLFNATDKVSNGKLSGKNTKFKTSDGRESSILTLLLSRPSSSPSLTRINILINLSLLLAVAEFVAYPFLDPASEVIFTRVGAVYPEAVKLVVRYPYLNTSDVQVVWRESLISGVPQNWSAGPILHLEGEFDWVDTVTLGGLWPSTSYEYRLSTTNQTLLPYPEKPIQFRTFPDPRLPTGNHFRFLVSSCVTPNFPYVPFNGKTIKGFDLMARYLSPAQEGRPVDDDNSGVSVPESGGPTNAHSAFPSTQSIGALPPSVEFLMFLGDFIYADVPLYIGDNRDAYRRLYRRNYQSKSFRKIYEHLSVFYTYDDHEFIDNFVGQGNDSVLPFPNAYDAFRTYNGNANYGSTNTYYDFRYGDVAFFVMDTRRYRSDLLNPELPGPSMLGEKQLSAFFTWLGDVNSTTTFKFIVTSVPFTALWGYDAASDSWAGFPQERTTILDALHSVPNVIILSGDRHEFAVVEFNGAEYQHTIREVSTSPLSMFYIPLIQTLRMRSVETVQRKRAVVDITDNIAEPITTIEVPREQVLKYIPSGNYKWSAFEVNTTDLKRPTVRLEVSIDGSAVYNLDVIGTPVKLGPSKALGMFVPGSLKNMLDKMGIKPTKWF